MRCCFWFKVNKGSGRDQCVRANSSKEGALAPSGRHAEKGHRARDKALQRADDAPPRPRQRQPSPGRCDGVGKFKHQRRALRTPFVPPAIMRPRGTRVPSTLTPIMAESRVLKHQASFMFAHKGACAVLPRTIPSSPGGDRLHYSRLGTRADCSWCGQSSMHRFRTVSSPSATLYDGELFLAASFHRLVTVLSCLVAVSSLSCHLRICAPELSPH